ncbi:hypothetical protein M378DRAFT_72892 [Amanita muscaria Koide BX008]|uniref:Sensitive to high expression protein 9, mitochondrial n=1 Tax=Amanita muscaria (strain Koide BX008) TaxID=946122 RepID=A0A0C2SWQ7_AMAMK|nr:hypothetical protein M378DRAFT_72892 [Amanita muscaria Koide BX008]
MLRAFRPTAGFFHPFSIRNDTHYRPLHSAAILRQDRQRQGLDGSRRQGNGSEGDPGRRGTVEEDSSSEPKNQDTFPSLRDTTSTFQAPSPSSSKSELYSENLVQDNARPPNLEAIKQRLREWSEHTAVVVRTRADDFTARSKTKFSELGAHLNKVTGYEEIEALKRQVVEQEQGLKSTRQAAREAKRVYQQAVIQRSNSQREVNELLQRKSLWTDSDVGRFTTLVRQDHLYEQEEQRAKSAVDETEDAVDREFTQLMRIILARYHEEQVWSDKIRSASTYGSLAALGLNLVVFILAIAVVEPWKRRNLSKTFEKKIQELSVENAAKLGLSMQAIGKQLGQQEQLLEEMQGQLTARLEKLDVLESVRKSIVMEEEPMIEPAVATKSLLTKKEMEMVAIGIGAGACVTTLLRWFWA